MPPSSSRSLLAAIAVLLLLSATSTHARILYRVGHDSGDPCKDTDFPMLCQAVAKSGNFKTKKDLEVAAIKQAIARVNQGIAAADRAMMAVHKSDTMRMGYLDNCKTNYATAVQDLQTALDYLTGSGTQADFMTNLSAALTDIDTCGSEWEESEMKGFPLEHVDKNLTKLIRNLLALGEGLKGPNN